jgi:hypothetical protein
MTQDEIIEMARKAGFEDFVRWSERYPHEVQRWIERMTAFTKLVAAKEREACAKAFEAEADTWIAWQLPVSAKRKWANAIRARGEQHDTR